LDNNLKLQQSVIPAGIFGTDEIRLSLTQKYNANAVAQLDQVVFDKSMLIGLKANKYNKQQADLNIEQSQEAIIYNISTAWFRIFVYNQQLELLNYNKGNYEKQMEIYRLQVSKGTTLQKDLDKVAVNYNNTISQIRVAEINIQLAENELKFEMGFPIDDPLAIKATPEAELLMRRKDSSEIFSPSLRADYKLATLNIKVLEIEQARIKAEGLPRLSGYIRYGAVGFGSQLKGAYDELLPYSAIGLKLAIPVLDFYKRNARYKEARINRINAEEYLKLAEGKYKLEYENARTKLLQAQANVENDQRNVTLAESVLKVTDLQFQKGTTDLTDWLNTQHSLKEAQNSYLNSLNSYYQARIDLEKATGTLRSFYNSF
jgi:outer membrane protein TolC